MKTLLVLASLVMLATTLPAAEHRTDKTGKTSPAHNPPRANQGHIPPAPLARTNPGGPRETEHLPTGHVNDTPHVNHDQWFGHESAQEERFRIDHPFPHGRFAHVGPAYRYGVTRIDLNAHRFWFPGGFSFEVAAWDWPLCVDWCWNCGDDFVLYDDPDHIGWNLLYNVHTGAYVHVQYWGQ